MNVFIQMVVLFFICSFGIAQQAEQTESPFKTGCRQCHDELIKEWDAAQVRHFPYQKQKCEVCHGQEHKTFNAEIGQICVICHKSGSEKLMKAHESFDVSGAKCLSCHYIHGSAKQGLLKEYEHKPFESKMCVVCHDKGEDNKPVVKKNIKDTCQTCHSDKQIKDGDEVHAGFESSECQDCHSPHTSPYQKMLWKDVSVTCFDCHDKDVAAKHAYDAVPSKEHISLNGDLNWLTRDGKVTCVSCHDPHKSGTPFMLREPLTNGELCYECHKK